MKKLLVLADPNSMHTYRWVESLKDDFCIYLIGFANSLERHYSSEIKVDIISVDESIRSSAKTIGKLKYLFSLLQFKTAYKAFDPDTVHSYYATSYGLIGALLNPKNFHVSIWGSDIFDFPKRSIFHKSLFSWILFKADKIYGTSKMICNEVQLYSKREPIEIPFGIDTELFSANKKQLSNPIRICCVKYFRDVYDIPTIISALYNVLQTHPTKDYHLHLVGDGPLKHDYISLINELDLHKNVTIEGEIENSKLPEFYKEMDIAVVASHRESFGVSVLEAMATLTPVFCSDIESFNEIADENLVSYFPVKDVTALANLFLDFESNTPIYEEKAQKALKAVKINYSWEHSISLQKQAYKD